MKAYDLHNYHLITSTYAISENKYNKYIMCAKSKTIEEMRT